MYRRSGAPALACSLLSLCLLAGCGGREGNPSVATTRPATASAVAPPVEAPFPIPVIEMAGTGEDMGAAHGRQLGDTIRDLHSKYLKAYFSSEGQRFLAMTAAATFEKHVSPEHMEEILALARASGVSPRQMLLAHCFLDLSPMTACSTVTLPASASPDGVARFGRNLDFSSFNVADKMSVVQVYRPSDGRNAFMAVGWPGLCGVLSGMNEHGLALANMEVRRPVRLPQAMPYVLLYRTVLERCATVNEAVELLRSTPRQSANNLMLMDATDDRAVVEITPDAIHVRRAGPAQALISTNHQRGDDLTTRGRCNRYDSLLKETSKQNGHIDVPSIESMLADACQGKRTLQSMVFEPSTRVIYLSTGKDAAHKTFHRLDLKKYFAPPKTAVATGR